MAQNFVSMSPTNNIRSISSGGGTGTVALNLDSKFLTEGAVNDPRGPLSKST